MQTVRSFVGLDVHKESISISVAEDRRSGQVRFIGVIPNQPDDIAKMAKPLARHGELDFCYEASCCGYGIHRQLTLLGHRRMVVAPSMIPRKPGERIKTDRRRFGEAAHLASRRRPDTSTFTSVSTRTQESNLVFTNPTYDLRIDGHAIGIGRDLGWRIRDGVWRNCLTR